MRIEDSKDTMSVWSKPSAIVVSLFLAFPLSQALGQTTGDLPTPLFDVGVIEGPSTLMFGEISDMDSDWEGGYLFLLDPLRGVVSVFSQDGVFVDETGGLGGGPGEFRVPQALAVAGSEIFVLDRGTLRIKRLVFESDSLRLKSGITLLFDTDDICVMGKKIFLIGLHEGHLIHRISVDGRLEASFGEPFLEDPTLARATAKAHLICDRNTGSIFVVGRLVPVARRYAASGRLLWETNIPEYEPTLIERSGRGGVRFARRDPLVDPDVTVAVTRVGEDLLVQFGKLLPGMGSWQDVISVESVSVDVSNGEVSTVRSGWPRIDHVIGNLGVSHANDPQPRIRGFTLPKDGSGDL